MNILAHRGLGFGQPENSLAAFRAAAAANVGLEFDIRSHTDGRCVVSHNPATRPYFYFEDALPALGAITEPIAVHLKTAEPFMIDAVCNVAGCLENLFLFDLLLDTGDAVKASHPGIQLGFSVAEARFSPTVYLLDDVLALPMCDIIWWDEWEHAGSVYNTVQRDQIRKAGKKIYAISPELHAQGPVIHENARAPQKSWAMLRDLGVDGICTDFPRELRAFLNS